MQVGEEIARLRAPDARSDAVITRWGGGGATVGFVTHVYIVPAGVTVSRDDHPALTATRVSPDLQMQWLQPDLLEITYQKAQINNFTNAVYIRELARPRQEFIEVRLRPRADRAL